MPGNFVIGILEYSRLADSKIGKII
jgi:hypothetical protein